MSYAWIITEDKIDQGTAIGVIGPSDAPKDMCEQLKSGEGRTFRMLDDDDKVYYKGRIIADDPGSEEDFGPLDDYGTPNAGCMSIEYRENGSWQPL